MRRNMLLLSLAALLSLVGVSIWATGQIGIGDAIRALVGQPTAGTHPWFIATLFDAYFGFLWFWAWIAYKETSNAARALWLVLVLGLGNIAMAAYMLLQLHRLPADATPAQLLLRRA
jgi:hypothetical protein